MTSCNMQWTLSVRRSSEPCCLVPEAAVDEADFQRPLPAWILMTLQKRPKDIHLHPRLLRHFVILSTAAISSRKDDCTICRRDIFYLSG